VIHRLGLGEKMDNVDVGRQLDLLNEDLARLGMVRGLRLIQPHLTAWPSADLTTVWIRWTRAADRGAL
jgi:hypothetical protein